MRKLIAELKTEDRLATEMKPLMISEEQKSVSLKRSIYEFHEKLMNLMNAFTYPISRKIMITQKCTLKSIRLPAMNVFIKVSYEFD